MLEAGGTPVSLLDINQGASVLLGSLEHWGADVYIPSVDRDYAISVGLRMLTLRHLVLEEDGSHRTNPKELVDEVLRQCHRPSFREYASAVHMIRQRFFPVTRAARLLPYSIGLRT
jgi:hypothetical protein